PAGTGDDHLQAAAARRLSILHHALGRAVRGYDTHFMRYIKFSQDLNGMAHGLPIRLATHDDADQGLSGDHIPEPVFCAAERRAL
ncbi:MAG TPA: hypothetical protein VN229_19630, partial [Terriglobales bacterium]|nr:hypothetical protein [Terriglobales bacterium]